MENDVRRLGHSAGGSLIFGVCRNKWCFVLRTSATQDEPIAGCGGGAAFYTCHTCYNDPSPAFWPYGEHCYHRHNCRSCTATLTYCPDTDSIGCNDVTGATDANQKTLLATCASALTKKTINWDINMVHNEFDSTPVSFGNIYQYLTNSEPDCFVHCYLSGNGVADPSGYYTQSTYISVNKRTGQFTYYLSTPFYLPTVYFGCDNGFQRYYYSFALEVACHSTSTIVTMDTNVNYNFDQSYKINLVDTLNPNYNFPKWSTSQRNCPLDSWPTSTRDTQGNPLNNLLRTTIEASHLTWTNPIYRIQTQTTEKYKKEKYYFYIRYSARGGAYNYTNLLSLDVYCGVNSTVIYENSEGGHSANQIQEVGSNHGFYFTEFKLHALSFYCPIETYVITTTSSRTTPHPDFP